MKGKLNILISILATAIIILLVCIFVIVFVIFKKPDNDIQESSSDISSSESSEESQEFEESSSKPETSSSEEINSEPKKTPEKLDISSPGEYISEEECLDVMISSDGVTLSNKEIDGNLIIKAPNSKKPLVLKNLSISGDIIMENYNADIKLDNVNVGGNIIFSNFGGWKSEFNNVTADEFRLRSLRGELPPTVTISGETEFSKSLVYCVVNLEQKNLAEGWKGYTHIGIGGYKPKLWNDISIINVNNCYLTVNFPANVKLNNSKILESYTFTPAHFYGNGTINKLYARSDNISYENNIKTVSNMNGHKAINGGSLINKNTLGYKDNSQKPSDKNSNNSQSSDNYFEKPELPE